MAKKSSMPDFTFALGADLREAAAKMRKMSQPPKHQSDEAIDAMLAMRKAPSNPQ